MTRVPRSRGERRRGLTVAGSGTEERCATDRVEEVEPRRVDREPYRVAHPGRRPRIDASVEQRAAVGHEIRRRILVLAERLGCDAGRVHAEEDVCVGTELLEHDHLDVERRKLGGRE